MQRLASSKNCYRIQDRSTLRQLVRAHLRRARKSAVSLLALGLLVPFVVACNLSCKGGEPDKHSVSPPIEITAQQRDTLDNSGGEKLGSSYTDRDSGRGASGSLIELDTSRNVPELLDPASLERLREELRICGNSELMKFISILQRACTAENCTLSQLAEIDSQVDKSVLLGTLRSPFLQPVHLFFPVDLYELSDIVDWETTKGDQLRSTAILSDPANTVVFVLGKASPTGLREYDRSLSYTRMMSVLRFLRDDLGISCGGFRIGYFGHEYLQFSKSDAALLNIPVRDFRDDVDTLNQAVHVFAYPCASMLNRLDAE